MKSYNFNKGITVGLAIIALLTVTTHQFISYAWSGNNVIANTSSTVSMQTYASHGGAFVGVFWNGKNFINNYDHGRQLQSAWQRNGNGDAENPTEAGSNADGSGSTTDTVLADVIVDYDDDGNDDDIYTAYYPAYWLTFNSKENTYSSGDIGYKHVKVGVGSGDLQRVIRYDTAVNYRGDSISEVAIEIPTGYLGREFDSFYEYDSGTSSFDSISTSALPGVSDAITTGHTTNPMIIATSDGNYAMGIYSPNSGVTYVGATYNVSANNENETTKWAITKEHSVSLNSTHNYRSYIVVGNLSDVEDIMVNDVIDTLN